MNIINRDVYVLRDVLKDKIDYMRGTNAVPIYFHFRDYEIPEGAEAKVFVIKPSGKAVYNKVRHIRSDGQGGSYGPDVCRNRNLPDAAPDHKRRPDTRYIYTACRRT